MSLYLLGCRPGFSGQNAQFSHMEPEGHLSPVASMMNMSHIWGGFWCCSKEQDPAKHKGCQHCSLVFPVCCRQQCMKLEHGLQGESCSPRETDPSPVVSLMQTPGKGTSFAKLRGQLTLERWDSFASNCMFLLLGTAAKQIIPESNGWDLWGFSRQISFSFSYCL